MLTKFICKLFNLISRQKMKVMLHDILFKMAYTQTKLKESYDNEDFSEWAYYKKLWKLRGRLLMLEDIIDTLK